MFFRAELHRRWRAWLALALVVGAFAGAVEAAAAGARRTDAAYPSLLAWSGAPDVLLFSFPGASGTFAQFSPREAAAVPQARQAAILVGYAVASPAAAQVIAPESTLVPSRFWRRRILSGRLPDPARPDEVDISFTLAQAAHLGAGDVLRATLLTPAGRPVPFAFRIVGIDAAPSEFPPQTGTGTDTVWATPAFYRAHRSGLDTYTGVALRLRHGSADLPAVRREMSRLTGGKYVQSYPLATQAANTERSIHLQAVALWLVAALLAVISVLVLGQLLARMSFLDSVEYRTLRALGLSRRTLLVIGLARAAADRRWPEGWRAPWPRWRFPRCCPSAWPGWPTLIRGSAPTAWSSASEWPPRCWSRWPRLRGRPGGRRALARRSRAWAARPRPARGIGGGRSSWPRLTSGIGSVTAMLGIRLALQPGAGRTAVPVRSTVASAVVGVAALTGALVFSASLGHLLATPRLYGVTWDAYVSNTQQHGVGGAIRGLTGRPGVTAWSAGYSGVPLTVGGVRADAIAMLPGHHGDLLPVPVQGHLPREPDEITVGEKTLAAMHARIGQTVAVSLDGFRPGRYRIAGTAVFPTMSDSLGLGGGPRCPWPGCAACSRRR